MALVNSLISPSVHMRRGWTSEHHHLWIMLQVAERAHCVEFEVYSNFLCLSWWARLMDCKMFLVSIECWELVRYAPYCAIARGFDNHRWVNRFYNL
eukprot:scaffold93266_cov54-Attheya_sp.AAC.3